MSCRKIKRHSRAGGSGTSATPRMTTGRPSVAEIILDRLDRGPRLVMM
jgi:hypothetical protein